MLRLQSTAQANHGLSPFGIPFSLPCHPKTFATRTVTKVCKIKTARKFLKDLNRAIEVTAEVSSFADFSADAAV
jgi:hypothetical protein